MKYFFGRNARPLGALERPDHTLWLFDFDGTLSPIVRRPEGAALTPRVKQLLRKLSQRFPGNVGVLSGRPLGVLRQKAGLPNLIYGAVHGYEFQGPRWRWVFPDPLSDRRRLAAFAQKWRPKLAAIGGLWLEDKKWTLCIHYREVGRRDRRRARERMRQMCREAKTLGFRIQEAVESVEILCSPAWHKGRSALDLEKRLGCSGIFYVGDDGTDEPVFSALRASDVGVRVGPSSSTRARYYLKRQSEMARLLEEILKR